MEHLHTRRDSVADAAYLALTDIGPGEAVQIFDGAGDLVGALDLAGDGRVLGIEFLNASLRVPSGPGD